jgi:hypothetical protein
MTAHAVLVTRDWMRELVRSQSKWIVTGEGNLPSGGQYKFIITPKFSKTIHTVDGKENKVVVKKEQFGEHLSPWWWIVRCFDGIRGCPVYVILLDNQERSFAE